VLNHARPLDREHKRLDDQTKQIWAPKSHTVALRDTMDALEAALLEPLGVAIHAVDLARPRLL
jgi:L-iditol 2-dehydrogenase